MDHLLQLLHTRLAQLDYGTHPPQLYDPIRYMMDLGGKRIRPLLTLLGTQLFGGQPEEAVMPALGVEVFHNFTLMHDDIMDQAPLRRGKPTVHHKWSSTTAILSGDVMLIKAYELVMQVPDHLLRQAMELFNKTAIEVCEGQQLDINFETRDEVSLDEYLQMIRLKTAVLLGFAMQLGALIGGAPAAQAELLCQFATNIGIAFQLKDDLLDVYADKDKFGKQVGGDILANKKTFLLLSALKLANEEQRTWLRHWLNAEEANPEYKVEAVTELYNQIGVKELTSQKMEEYFALAMQQLKQVEADEAGKQQIQQLAEELMYRDR